MAALCNGARTARFFCAWYHSLLAETRNSSHYVELGVCPMQLFHFWSRDVHPVQNLPLCTNFVKIRWFFTEIWRYIDFQNGGRPPSWNCFTTIRDHPRSLCCWPQLPVKFRIILIHRSEDIAIWIFRIFGLKCLFRPQHGDRILGDFGPLYVIIHHRDPQKAHPCLNPRLLSYQL